MISGFFDPSESRPIPRVAAFLYLPQSADQVFTVDFLLDTGAGMTCLHPNDALHRAGMSSTLLSDPRLWPSHERAGGIGGGALYYVVPAIYGFLTDDGRLQAIDGQIRIAQLRPDNAGLPSLLGWDILEQFEVVIDWRSLRVELR